MDSDKLLEEIWRELFWVKWGNNNEEAALGASKRIFQQLRHLVPADSNARMKGALYKIGAAVLSMYGAGYRRGDENARKRAEEEIKRVNPKYDKRRKALHFFADLLRREVNLGYTKALKAVGAKLYSPEEFDRQQINLENGFKQWRSRQARKRMQKK